MYHHFYHLKYDPFADSPDPEFLFLSPSHKTALQTLLSGIAQRRGLLGIFGAAGLGKTILLRAFLEGVHEQQRLKTIQIFYPKIAYQDMFEMIFRGLDLTRTTDDPAELFPQLHQELLAQYNQGWNVVLIVDDFQDMSEQTRTSLLCLSDLKAPTGVPLLQIVLVGLPETRRLLKMSVRHPLTQSLTSQATLAPLTPKESLAYIRHRLAKVLVPEESLFLPGALKPIIRVACGNPRILNTLCANVLITGVMQEQKPISPALVQEVITEFHGKDALQYVWRGGTVAAGILLGAGLWVGWQFLGPPRPSSDHPVPSAVTLAAPDHLPPLAAPPLALPESPVGEKEETVEVPSRPEVTGPREKASPVKQATPSRTALPRETTRRDSPAVKPKNKPSGQGKTLPAKPGTSRRSSPVREVEKPLDPLPRSFFEALMRRLKISSQPTGATVTIGRRMVGRTPLTVHLASGMHTITLEKMGYSRISYDVNLKNHPKRDLYYDLLMEGGHQ